MSVRDSNTKAKTAPESIVSAAHRSAASSTRTRVAVSRLLQDGEQFGKYEVVRWIARGGMSEVYEAIHTGLRKPVALKVLRAELADNPEARDRFALEGSNAALVRHPNVVDVSDVGFVDELPYLVMELLEGDSLGDILERIGRMPVSDAVDLLLPVTAAVSAAHDQGVIHRDLKPDNIFLQYEGPRIVPKVLDFGASRAIHRGRLTMNSSVLGTPHYMSPEQARGEASADARSDQHALGVILYEAVVGCLPRESSDPLELLHQVAYGPFRPPSDHMALPDGLEAVIVRAMAREPGQRFPTTRDFGLALLPFASDPSREYWKMELRHPSTTGRSVDIAQPAVSSRRFTPGTALPPSAPDASLGPAVLIPMTEAGIKTLPSSRPPPALRRPERSAVEVTDDIAEARPSSKRRLAIAGVIAAAIVAGVMVLGARKESPPERAPDSPRAASPAIPAPAAAAPEEAASAAGDEPQAAPSATSKAAKASSARDRVAPARKPETPKKVEPAKKAETAAPPEPAAARPVATQEPAPKVRLIEEAKPKVKVIE